MKYQRPLLRDFTKRGSALCQNGSGAQQLAGIWCSATGSVATSGCFAGTSGADTAILICGSNGSAPESGYCVNLGLSANGWGSCENGYLADYSGESCFDGTNPIVG